MRRRSVTSVARRFIATTDGHNQGRRIVVIGGGIGGFTAALAFAKTGGDVVVYERAAAITEIGAGLQISPNGWRVLERLLSDSADFRQRATIAARAVVPTDGITGRTVTRFDLQARHYAFCHRSGLLQALQDEAVAAGVSVVTGVEVLAIDGALRVGGELVVADVVVGADGLKSVTRGVLNPADAPFFTGQVAWRAIVAAVAPPEARIWMLPGRHVVTYPLPSRDGPLLNVVAVEEREAFAADGWAQRGDPADLRDAFDDASDPLKAILKGVEETGLWGLFRYPVAETWQDGRLSLLGDAAHPTLPFLAQGANLAIEDAYVLARCCDENSDVEVALQVYEEKRKNRVKRAIKAANANAVNYHLRGPRRAVSHAVLATIGKVAPDAFLNRLSWLYDHDVTA